MYLHDLIVRIGWFPANSSSKENIQTAIRHCRGANLDRFLHIRLYGKKESGSEMYVMLFASHANTYTVMLSKIYLCDVF